MKTQLRKIRALGYKMLYRNPTRNMHLVGITGTDGKSTTAEMIYQVMRATGKSSGIISTIGGKINGSVFDTGLHTSTPRSSEIYRSLALMRDAHVVYAAIELTSHGLAQHRAHGIILDGCVFTNITHEHLDYHKTFEQYRDAKCRIIDMVVPEGFVVINKDDPNWEYLAEYARKRKSNLKIVFYTTAKKQTKEELVYQAVHIEAQHGGYIFDVKLANSTWKFILHMEGFYNIHNALAAVSSCVQLKLPLKSIITGIKRVRNIKGRMDIIQKIPFRVVVDFAHTPNAYAHILPELRNSTKENLIVVFGCPGKRDTSKRKPMGEMAAQYANTIVITAEDPRNESFMDIANNILEGIPKDKFIQDKNLFLIPSREKAIAYTIASLIKPGDTLACLGKGHEMSNCVGDVEYPWDERRIVVKYLRKYHKTHL